jgi:hypothetical protein
MVYAATNDELLSKILKEADQIEQKKKTSLISPKNASSLDFTNISHTSNRTNPNHASMH